MGKKENHKTAINIFPSDIAGAKLGASEGAVELGNFLCNKLPNIDVFFNHASNKIDDVNKTTYAINIHQVKNNLAIAYHSSLENISKYDRNFFITGDHSNAIACFSAFSDFHGVDNCGLIWIDAHADLHTPFTTPSGNIHGMTIAALLGLDNKENQLNKIDDLLFYEWQTLKDIGVKNLKPKLKPENILYIGLRDFEEEEILTIQNLGIQFLSPNDLNSIHLRLNDFLFRLKNVYISFDIDALDAGIIKATGTPVANGLSIANAEQILNILINSENVKAIEFSEFNKLLDDKSQSSFTTISQLILKQFIN